MHGLVTLYLSYAVSLIMSAIYSVFCLEVGMADTSDILQGWKEARILSHPLWQPPVGPRVLKMWFLKLQD